MGIEFYGWKENGKCEGRYLITDPVEIDGNVFWETICTPLSLYLEEISLAPYFEFGVKNEGALQLSYAILRKYFEYAEYENPQELAKEFYVQFCNESISKITWGWVILGNEIEHWFYAITEFGNSGWEDALTGNVIDG